MASRRNCLLAFLSEPSSYRDGSTSVQCVETHMAWVFLTDREAWKLKKPVRFPFLDFSTLERRREICENEVRLNRRLAPHVYIDAVPVVRTTAGTLRIGPRQGSRTVDWLVRMHRLPAERMLDHVIRSGGLLPGELPALVEVLVDFYERVPVDRCRPPPTRRS